jgi:putative transposase
MAKGVTMKKRFTEEQIIKAIKRFEAGENYKDICREMGIANQTFYHWKSKFSGMEVSDAKKLRELETQNAKLKRMLSEAMMTIEDLRFVNSKNW